MIAVDVLESGLRQGLLLLPLAVGVHIAFRLARYPDLTADGSMILGGAASAVLLLNGQSALVALVAGALVGGLLGSTTAMISEFLGVDRVLAGIATSLMAYSLALRVMGRGNTALPAEVSTLYSQVASDVWVSAAASSLLLLTVCIVAVSRFGLRLRAVGENEELASLLGANTSLRLVAGLFWANACVGLAGALLLQYQRFADVGQGTGSLFVGIACVLIGTAMPGHSGLVKGIVWSAAGATIYSCLIAAALQLGLRPGDLRGLTALFVVLITLLARRVSPGDRLPLFG